jgi:hypothetical protein
MTRLYLHTGQLEAYHSLLLQYASKEVYFTYDGMVLRTILAAMDHNHGIGREKIGERVAFCPAKKTHVIKPTFAPKSQQWRVSLVEDVVKFASTEPDLVEFSPEMETTLFPFNLPDTITGPTPTVEELRARGK